MITGSTLQSFLNCSSVKNEHFSFVCLLLSFKAPPPQDIFIPWSKSHVFHDNYVTFNSCLILVLHRKYRNNGPTDVPWQTRCTAVLGHTGCMSLCGSRCHRHLDDCFVAGSSAAFPLFLDAVLLPSCQILSLSSAGKKSVLFLTASFCFPGDSQAAAALLHLATLP